MVSSIVFWLCLKKGSDTLLLMRRNGYIGKSHKDDIEGKEILKITLQCKESASNFFELPRMTQSVFTRQNLGPSKTLFHKSFAHSPLLFLFLPSPPSTLTTIAAFLCFQTDTLAYLPPQTWKETFRYQTTTIIHANEKFGVIFTHTHTI